MLKRTEALCVLKGEGCVGWSGKAQKCDLKCQYLYGSRGRLYLEKKKKFNIICMVSFKEKILTF